MNDLQLTESGDLIAQQGDWHIGHSEQQHIQLLLSSVPGEWKENPETGVALALSQKGLMDGFIKRTIAVQLEADGFQVDHLQFTPNGLIIDAKRV